MNKHMVKGCYYNELKQVRHPILETIEILDVLLYWSLHVYLSPTKGFSSQSI